VLEANDYLRLPDDGIPYLEWFNKTFDAIFIALHPFVRVDGAETAPSYENVATSADSQDIASRQAQVDRIDRLSKSSGEPIQWARVQADCGFSSLAEL
jgi:hypothetical protein